MNRIPVLIAARNEEKNISRALESLSSEAEPIVIPNGCTDQTAEIAEKYGAVVLRTEIEGKMTAIQHGMRYLGKRALEPWITLDADSRPIFPKLWLKSLLIARNSLPETDAAIVTGPIIYSGSASIISDAYRTIRSLQSNVVNRNNHEDGLTSGANMLIHPSSPSIVEEILGLPQIWPGEDATIKDIVVAGGGRVLRSVNPGAAILTDSSRYIGVWQRFKDGFEKTRDSYFQTYIDEAPPNSVSGGNYKKSLSEN